jgi:hypothetical protein
MKKLAIMIVLALAACTQGKSELPACSTGRGTDGSTSVLRIQQDGEKFTGTYDVTMPDAPADTALRYSVEGTAKDGKLQSTWTVGATVVKVNGSYTDKEITLDNPSGEFSTTRFTAGCEATTTTARGYDPTKPTTVTTSPTQATYAKLVADLQRHGFKVGKVTETRRDPLVPKLRLWELKINGVGSLIGVASTDEALTTKLEMLNNFGSIAVFSTTSRWIINPESAMTDDATFAKSEKLATAIGKALYNDWQGSVRLSVPK